MAIDLYFKLEDDKIFNPYAIEEESDYEIFLQQLDMILTTRKGSILGDPEFGLSLDQYLWSFSGGSGSIKQDIYQQITQYVEFQKEIPYDIDVNFVQGEVWDTILIDIYIKGNKVAGYWMNP